MNRYIEKIAELQTGVYGSLEKEAWAPLLATAGRFALSAGKRFIGDAKALPTVAQRVFQKGNSGNALRALSKNTVAQTAASTAALSTLGGQEKKAEEDEKKKSLGKALAKLTAAGAGAYIGVKAGGKAGLVSGALRGTKSILTNPSTSIGNAGRLVAHIGHDLGAGRAAGGILGAAGAAKVTDKVLSRKKEHEKKAAFDVLIGEGFSFSDATRLIQEHS